VSRKRSSTLAIVVGGMLLLVAGGLLVVAETRQLTRPNSDQPRSARPTPAKPCPRPDVQTDDRTSRHRSGPTDSQEVGRPSARHLATTLLTAVAAGGVPSRADAAPARPADGFVDSIGVNVHLGYNDTAYVRHDIVQKKLVRLGVRYVRDGLFPNRPDMYEAFQSLARCGIKADLIVGDPLQRWTIGPIDRQLSLIKQEKLGDAVESLEGPNEYDLQGDPNWQRTLRDYQRRLYRGVKSDPYLRRFPVLGPTVVAVPSYGQLGSVSSSLDYGNIHPYPGGEEPGGKNTDLTDELAWARKNSGSKPVQVTETGYHNGVHSSSTHLPATERAAGIYMPRLFLENYRRHVVRTYSYELLDQRPDPRRIDSEANFGLLRYDYSEKPAYAALRRTIDLLSDPGPHFKTSGLPYSLDGAGSAVQRMLLQKRDGTFYLAIWRDESVWNPEARKAVAAASVSVRLTLGRRARRIAVYRPSSSGKAVQAVSNATGLTLEASPSVSIVEITPASTRNSASAPYAGLKGYERRVARRYTRLARSPGVAGAKAKRRIARLRHWLVRRLSAVRHNARRTGWRSKNRRVRYQGLRRMLRRI
jgi:hypothetical protein